MRHGVLEIEGAPGFEYGGGMLALFEPFRDENKGPEEAVLFATER